MPLVGILCLGDSLILYGVVSISTFVAFRLRVLAFLSQEAVDIHSPSLVMLGPGAGRLSLLGELLYFTVHGMKILIYFNLGQNP